MRRFIRCARRAESAPFRMGLMMVVAAMGVVLTAEAAELAAPMFPYVPAAETASYAESNLVPLPPVEEAPAPAEFVHPPTLDSLPSSRSAPSAESLPRPMLEDGLAPSGVGMTIDQAINSTIVNDPVLRAGLEIINQANADTLTASLAPNPEFFTDGQLLPLTRPFTVTRQGGPPQQDFYLSYPIDWFLFGKRAAAMCSAGLGVRVTEAEYADLVRVRVTETALAYYDVLEAKGLLSIARQDVANLERVAEVTRVAVQSGGRAEVELNRILLDLLSSRRTLRLAEAALATTRAALWARLGCPEIPTDFEIDGTLDSDLAPDPPSVEEAFDIALRNRPDINSQRLRVEQANANVELERRRAYPTIVPELGYTRQYQQKAIGFPDADSWAAGVTMSLPLFDRNQGNRAKAVALVNENSFKLRSFELELRAEIEAIEQELLATRQIAELVADEQLQLAAQVRDSINTAYEAGGRPLLDVLDAQRNYRETYRLYITSRAHYWKTVRRFDAALGFQLTNCPTP